MICRGVTVESMVENTTAQGNSPNLNRLKGDICRAVCGDELTGVDIGSLQLSLFGRDKKSLKLDCVNPSSKIHLLKQARKNKPHGVFVSEYLTPTKSSIFYNLRQLKK